MKNWIKKNNGKVLKNKSNNHQILFVFDWLNLTEIQQSFLAEYQLLILTNQLISENKKPINIFSNELIPFALLNPEKGLESENLFYFESQSDGVLLFKENSIFHCVSSDTSDLTPFKESAENLKFYFIEV